MWSFQVVILNLFFHIIMGFEKNLTPEESLKEDMLLDTVEIMNKYKYYGEEHTVVTEDGYILGIHHMKQKKVNSLEEKKNYPVFIMHGMGSSSFDWVSPGPGKTLPHELHDLGFDVWLGNARGNMYSRKHVNMTTSDPKFWLFSWHQIGHYDLKAMIDYVLQNTSASKLHYIGHSQGCTSFFVLASTRPEFNKKIQSMNALAPPIFMGKANKVLMKVKSIFQDVMKSGLLPGTYQIPPISNTFKGPIYNICRDGSSMMPICILIEYLIGGENKDLLNTTLLPLAVSHVPAGLSLLQVHHYSQLIQSGRFSNYDHGKKNNLKIYGNKVPPDYPIEKVDARVALHYSDNDFLIAGADVKRLRSKLSNVVLFRRVPHPEFNHLDYLFSINISYYIYDSVIEIIKKYDKY